ncbi:MAG: hypothetical protein ACLRX7_00200 [Acutalibacteraceae bacterium]
MKRIVLALGGNALGQTPQEQIQLVKKTAKSIVDLVEEGYEIVVGHEMASNRYDKSCNGFCICPWSQNAIYAVSGMWRDVAGIYWIPLAAGNPV